MSRIVVMGSGETAPTMARTHREILADTLPGPAVLLDTPFAFQNNRDDLVARTCLYFSQSVGRDLEVVRWPAPAEDPAAGERSLALLDRATWAFAGPGSPTYALGQWQGSGVPPALAGVVRRGGTVVMGSAAALTLGSHTVPVYEIYKVGAAPTWVPGLDLLGQLAGFPVAVVPHYDNREGGGYDTRFCYLGESRLALLEEQLPEDVGILGVDEHTAAVLDLGAGVLRVAGNGLVSVRQRGATRTIGAGEELPITELAALLRGQSTGGSATPRAAEARPTAVATGGEVQSAMSLREEADRARASFEEALVDRDVDGCVQAVLVLEAAITAWGADTRQSDDLEEARRVLRALVVRLGEVAVVGARDPRASIAPYVDLLLELRAAARESKDFATSDLVRDRLVALKVNVHDTPGGSSWDLVTV